MEDAHVVHMREDSAFFGVFDGHGGSECSQFVARSLNQQFEKYGFPDNDASVEALMLRVDKEFLKTSDSKSGSTGTFVFVEPGPDDSKRCLRVGNIGDSRVLLGRLDGSIVRGSGTDFGLTTDHKPDSPSEMERIVSSGNSVIKRGAIHRVNGNLSVSRSFGDVRFKLPKDSPPEEQCICAKPDLCRVECDHTDFVMLVCDGISEGSFPNANVVSVAAAELRNHGDPGIAATAVCRKALQEGSTDNLTCMIVLLGGGSEILPREEFLRGPLWSWHDLDFMKAYMAHYDACGVSCVFVEHVRRIYANILEKQAHLDTRLQNREIRSCDRLAHIPSEEVVRKFLEENTNMRWHSNALACVYNTPVKVVREDPSDGTSKVCYGPCHNELWVPTALLANL
jgi:serine/threonine protein phosphatase PrpC